MQLKGPTVSVNHFIEQISHNEFHEYKKKTTPNSNRMANRSLSIFYNTLLVTLALTLDCASAANPDFVALYDDILLRLIQKSQNGRLVS